MVSVDYPRAAPPATLDELRQRARALAGRDLASLAAETGLAIPDLVRAKGWAGQLLEGLLGASAGSRAEADFPGLGVELKTLPVTPEGVPLESTYVCTVPLRPEPGVSWETSWVRNKLRRVLWLPVVMLRGAEPAQRRVGSAILWDMPPAVEEVLRQDWQELMELVSLGRFDRLSAGLGTWLQIRPKAADSRALSEAVDARGRSGRTNPRGFYLRPALTRRILAAHFGMDRDAR